MIDEGLRICITQSLKESYQIGGNEHDAKVMAHHAAVIYGQERGLLGAPLSDVDLVAVSVAVETVIKQTPRNQLLAVLSLEYIGENYFMYKAYQKRGMTTVDSPGTERYGEYLGRDKSRPWVARISGFHHTYGFERKFVNGRADYSQASSNGNRGVFLHFYLTPGYYEVNSRVAWKNVRRYFVRVEGIEITEITKQDLEEYLQG